MPEVKFEITRHIGILSERASGWTKELNLVSWNDREAKYDIREWSPEKDKMGKGVTLTRDELISLKSLLNDGESVMQQPKKAKPKPKADVSGAWKDTLEQIFDGEAAFFAGKCIELGVPAPSTVGYELVGKDNKVIGEAEFVWESLNIVFLTPMQEKNTVAFVNNGWQVITTGDEISPLMFTEE